MIRSKVWFPGINTAVESAVKHCIPCQANSNRREYEPLSMSELPPGPWQHLSIDFCGPLPSGESLLVITDEYSRYPVVEILTNTGVENVIPIVDKVLSQFGYPIVIKSDNGPQFRSKLWQDYMKTCGIEHRRITPLWPKANAQAESFNKPVMKAIRSAHVLRTGWKKELYKFCRMYRSTPHCSTLFTPHFLMFGRESRTKLPELNMSPHPADDIVRQRDAQAKLKMKNYADNLHNAKPCNIKNGDIVLVKQRKENKLSTYFDPSPMVVTCVKGSMITCQRSDGSFITRNSSMFHQMPPSTPITPPPEIVPHDSTLERQRQETQNNLTENVTRSPQTTMMQTSKPSRDLPELHDSAIITQEPCFTPRANTEKNVPQTPRRSLRQSKPPDYLKDFVCN